MKIIWNKITWLSQLVAIILFVIVFFAGMIVGKKVEDRSILGPIINHVVFVCHNNLAFQADFYDRLVHLEFSGSRVLYLPQTISASGVRYSNPDGSFIFWNKGNSAFIVQNGTTTLSDCVVR